MKNNLNKNIEGLFNHAPDVLPECGENETLACLVIRNNFPEVLFWDGYYKSWNDSEDDDHAYSADEELEWMPIFEKD